MRPRLILAEPIRGEVDADGRLLRADGPLQRLHMLAGGDEGGLLAVPPLAALAALVLRLKMRLSRAVQVADDSENLELWVEAHVENNIAKLAILSWRGAAQHDAGELLLTARDEQIDGLGHETVLEFDDQLRFISLRGQAPIGFDRHWFGKSAQVVIEALLQGKPEQDNVITAVTAAEPFTYDDGAAMSGKPAFAGADLAGYSIFIAKAEPVEIAEEPASDEAAPAISFGRQLAPVLRQPLGRIIANAETIGSELQGPIRDNYATYAKDIADAARHLAALVDDLGDLEAVEKADFSVARDNIELGDVARRVSGLLALKAADHSIRIVTPDPTQKIAAVAEFRRVLQIMLNLVTNAIRYSPDGTEVKIGMTQAEDFAEISVIDQGQGIAVEDRERIFEKFERLGRSGDGGSGLGLYISRRLARAMGGDLTVGAAGSEGAKFTLRLPLK